MTTTIGTAAYLERDGWRLAETPDAVPQFPLAVRHARRGYVFVQDDTAQVPQEIHAGNGRVTASIIAIGRDGGEWFSRHLGLVQSIRPELALRNAVRDAERYAKDDLALRDIERVIPGEDVITAGAAFALRGWTEQGDAVVIAVFPDWNF